MMEESNKQTPGSASGNLYMIEQMQRRMDDNDRERARAIEKQSDAYEKAIELQSENQEKRMEELVVLFSEKIKSGDQELLVRIESIKEAGDKLASERDRAAEALREANQRALDEASEQRSKSADKLVVQFDQKAQSNYENLLQHINQNAQELGSSRREMTIIHEASEKAIQKAEDSSNKRFASVNEFRAQLSDQAKEFMPRELADSQFTELGKRITSLQQSQDTNAGRDMGSDKTTALLIAVSTLVLGVVVVAVNILV